MLNDINHQDNQGDTFLMLAIRHGHVHLVKYLLDRGAEINIQNKKQQTALILAVRERQPSIPLIKYLLNNGADSRLKDKCGWSPWEHACCIVGGQERERLKNLLKRHCVKTHEKNCACCAPK